MRIRRRFDMAGTDTARKYFWFCIGMSLITRYLDPNRKESRIEVAMIRWLDRLSSISPSGTDTPGSNDHD